MRNKSGKIAVIIVLVLALAGILVLKQSKSPFVGRELNVSSGEAAQSVQQKTGLPRLVDLGADKCIPCKMMAPILEEIRREYQGRLEVTFIDVWKNPGAGREYGIRAIPTQIFYDASGRELFRHEGFYSKEDILSRWLALGIDINQP